MNREAALDRIRSRSEAWDLAVVGGGATGVGIAVDAASRGHAVVLLERTDFGKGTSSRSTKLVHGGVRYLQQGNVSLVVQALRERERLLHNAPHLVTALEFVVPTYAWWERAYYGLGLKAYGLLAGRHAFGPSQSLSREQSLARIPTLVQQGLRGGVSYYDGQFDDARLLIALVRTADALGACLVNHAAVVALHANGTGALCGLTLRDELTGAEQRLDARCIVNATGPFTDEVRLVDDPDRAPLVSPSQGAHVVLPRRFLPGSTALVVPRTSDGRVLFAIPWRGHTLVGTTDTPIPETSPEPRPLPEEVAFLLETAARHLDPAPTPADVLSVFAGIRPLVRGKGRTSALSRDHLVETSRSGLVTVTGGKWTTYRSMAEHAVNRAAKLAGLEKRPCVTRELRLHGWHAGEQESGDFAEYGADAPALRELAAANPDLAEPMHPDLGVTGAQIVWAARHEMAQTLEDVLARRTRALFLDARAALEIAPAAVAILARELNRDAAWSEAQLARFRAVAANYLPPTSTTRTAPPS